MYTGTDKERNHSQVNRIFGWFESEVTDMLVLLSTNRICFAVKSCSQLFSAEDPQLYPHRKGFIRSEELLQLDSPDC